MHSGRCCPACVAAMLSRVDGLHLRFLREYISVCAGSSTRCQMCVPEISGTSARMHSGRFAGCSVVFGS